MANFYGTGRTNYFKVRDVDKFKDWAEAFGAEVAEKEGRFALLPGEGCDDNCLPSRFDDKDEELIHIYDELHQHLADGEVAVVMEAGAEKLRYVSGWAMAINHKGESVCVGLTDIYELAEKKFGVKPTECSY
jgi:hypothetical protein